MPNEVKHEKIARILFFQKGKVDIMNHENVIFSKYKEKWFLF